MANRIFNDVQQWSDDDGTPLNGGKITFYEPGTVTLKDTYTDSSISTAHANPVILDSNGRPTSPIWLNGEYKYKVTTSADVAVGLTVDNLNKSTASAVETGLLVTNGSFEVDTNSDGQPDSWTISPLTAATIEIDTADSAHGKNSLKFTSGGSGGGTATSNRFDVLKSSDIITEFTHKSSSATALTKVDVKTYDKDDILLSTLSAYSEGAANPTSYSTENVFVTADATAVTAEIVITGIDAAGTTKTAGTTMNMDGISIVQSFETELGTAATPSGTDHTITGIPAWVKKVTLSFHNVSPDGADIIYLQLGDSGGIETSNYTYGYSWITSAAAADTIAASNGGGFIFSGFGAAADVMSGALTLSLIDSANNVWAMSGNTVLISSPDTMHHTAGSKALTGALTQLKLAFSSGASFDAGTINVLYEG